MLHFLVDEDLPRSLAPPLRAVGLLAQDVRDIGLRGSTDDVPPMTRNQLIVTELRSLSEEDIVGNLIVIEPGRVRIRRPNGGRGRRT